MPPAARLGDSTVHGGVITLGATNVLIGGLPAARMGDMHTCPMCNGPVPHVGGPIILGSMTVLIGGQPAARMNDQCVCTGPPDSIIMGCMTVLIGDGGGGGAPGSGGGGGGGTQVSSEATEEAENHFIDVSVVDKGGLPVTGIQYSLEDPDGQMTHGRVTGKIS
ncbi:MAG: PAAR domain-containing protein, partial [candidate division Zixibacteria bacterium]|nr:PAAR domain-containing protein [candidate division Zixibacteria bacterium]